MEGFLLGLSNGVVCFSYCAPVIMTYMLVKGSNTRRNFIFLGEFLLGRLCGYLLFASAAWIMSCFMMNTAGYRELIYGCILIALAVWLLISNFLEIKRNCAVKKLGEKGFGATGYKTWVIPFAAGLLTGLNLCPPMLLAFTVAAKTGGVTHIVLFFLTFFLGTSLYLLPIPFIGKFNIHRQLQLIGKMAAVIAAIYYSYYGVNCLLISLNNF